MSDKVDLKGVLFFDVSEEICTQRCLKRGAHSGRLDDNIETLKKRHQTYISGTKPIIDHYKDLGLVYTFDGEQSPDAVFVEVEKVLKKVGW